MANKPLTISDEAKVQMPMKTFTPPDRDWETRKKENKREKKRRSWR